MKKWPPEVMNKRDTIEYIKSRRCSIGRYGDGEVSLMVMIGIGFQKPSWKLRKDLIEIARSRDEGFLTCIPGIITDMSELKPDSQKWWKSNLRLMGPVWRHYFNSGKVFGDTEITRPWMEILNPELAQFCFSEIRSMWKDRDVVLIEGEKSRVGIGNDFFSEVKSLQRILCPVRNAYSAIDRIYKCVLDFGKDTLILLALGPTATVLAYRLYKAGYQALDIGHMDIEYEWFRMGATQKVPVKNKYVNEAGGTKSLVEDADIEEQYKSQVYCRIFDNN